MKKMKGRDAYIESKDIETLNVDAKRNAYIANTIQITQVLQGSQEQCDLEGKLMETINSRIFLPDYQLNNRIRIYRLERSANPSYETLDLRLVGHVPSGQLAREESRLEITGIYPHNGNLYTFVERRHSNREKEYRIFISDIDQKKTIHVSEGLRGGPSYKLGIPTLSEDILWIPQTDASGNHICKYENGTLVPVVEVSEEVEIAWPVEDSMVYMTKDQVFRDKEKLYSVPDQFTGYTQMTKDLLFFSKRNQLVALDVDSGKSVEYHSWAPLNDIVINGGIHMLTGDFSMLVYNHFDTKEDLLNNKSKLNMLMNTIHFKDLTRAWMQDPHVFFVAKDPDAFYAVYQENGKYHQKPIHVSQFEALSGEVQKDVL